ncbi:hypothetical protein ACH5RR_013368 [Cinchona calisaya]|uniref:Uncharacterized protein n=1 Tax=Cinchona calisaya TaxID=153742 RepID=A0ABD3A222_9GENT
MDVVPTIRGSKENKIHIDLLSDTNESFNTLNSGSIPSIPLVTPNPYSTLSNIGEEFQRSHDLRSSESESQQMEVPHVYSFGRGKTQSTSPYNCFPGKDLKASSFCSTRVQRLRDVWEPLSSLLRTIRSNNLVPLRGPPLPKPPLLKILMWNVREDASSSFKHHLMEYINKHKPGIIILTKGMVFGRSTREICDKLPFTNYNGEKLGGNVINKLRVSLFNDLLDDYNLLDLRFKGPQFTWWGKCKNGVLVSERFDKALCNADWCNLFKDTVVHHLVRTRSDHRHILLSSEPNSFSGVIPFRLEKF